MNWKWPKTTTNNYSTWYEIGRRLLVVLPLWCGIWILTALVFIGWGKRAAVAFYTMSSTF